MTAETPTGNDLPAPPDGNPWERRKQLGRWPAFLRTVEGMILAPRATLAATREHGGLWGPLLFALTVALLAGAARELVDFAVGLALGQAEGRGPAELLSLEIGGRSFTWLPASLASIGVLLFVLLGLVVGIPVFAVIFAILVLSWSAVVHLGLLLVSALRESSSGFQGTFRGVCFSLVALVAVIVPVAGEPAFLLWVIALQALAWIRFHGARPWQAVVATLLPLAVPAALVISALLLADGG